MNMEQSNLKEEEVVIDIENAEASHGARANQGVKKSLNRLVSGILGFNGLGDGEPRANSGQYPNETTEFLVDKSSGDEQSQELMSLVEKGNDKERRKGGKVKKAPKPPRPPKGPSLDAADMRLLKEISKVAIKKRERMERMKTLKKMKAMRLLSASAPSSSSSLSSSGATVSAMFVTVFFFLVLIFQVFGTSTSSNLALAGAPQPALETTGLTPVQFYKIVMSDDGAARGFRPPKSTEWLSGSEFESLED